MAAIRGPYSNAISGLRLTARARAVLTLCAVLLAGATFSLFNVPLASSAANSVAVAHIAQAVPLDPQAAVWNQALESEIPLSSQQIFQPGGGSTRAVYVRALEDGQNLGIRVSWDDDTRNDTTGNVPSDAAAVQFPIDPAHLPYQCMGQSSSRVNIWQWKAVLEREGSSNMGAQALEDAGVRNLDSNGICKAVDVPGLSPKVKSYHDGKQWHVVFYRALGKGGEESAPLMTTLNTSIAFAVWNGAKGEARGMKAVSTWNTLMFATPTPDQTGNLIALGFIIALSAGIVAFTMRRFGAGS